MEQLLRDPNIEPTPAIIADGLGKAYTVYEKFLKDLEKYSVSLMDWRYYNDGKAWLTKGEYKWTTTRGTQKVKPLFWLSIWQGYFKTSFFFATSLMDELLALPISDAAKELIRNSTKMGKTMKFMGVVLDIKTQDQLNDVYTLMEFRKEKVK